MKKSIALAIVLICSFLILEGCKKSPEQSLKEFYTYPGAEDMLMDPLILAGDAVVPLVIEKVKDQKMPRRRYAIGFLGNGSYRQALPLLESILKDETEQDFIRGDALKAIFRIDENLGTRYANQHTDDKNSVGVTAKDILKREKYLFNRRTYQDALNKNHD